MPAIFDVVIVGARCAGAATATLLARHGLRVLAIDRGDHGTDTLSTHALMRTAVLQLHRWGVLPTIAAATPPLRHAAFHYGDEIVDVPIKPRDGVDALYAPRRTLLDAALVDAARAAGAEVRHRVRLRSLVRDRDGRVRGVVVEDATGRVDTIIADLVVGADGRYSAVAREVGAPVTATGRHATAVVYGYWRTRPDRGDGYHFHYRPGVTAGEIPTGDGVTNVFVTITPERFAIRCAGDLDAGFRDALADAAPEVAASLAGEPPVGRLRGFGGLVGYLRAPVGPGWALVGDAGYFKDPVTAHGISDALRDAELLARAAVGGTADALAGYARARDALSLRLFEVTDRIASLAWELPEVAQLHRALNEEMAAEARAIAALGDASPLAA